MSMWHSPAQTVDDIGRLPVPTVMAPISQDDFVKLAAAWRSTGLWLSLWNNEGQVLIVDEQAPRFWKILWSSCEHFREMLDNFIGEALKSSCSNHVKKSPAPVFPLQHDLGVLVTPIESHRRTIGVVLGLFVQQTDFSESFVRLCSQGGLDVAAMKALARPVADQYKGISADAEPILHLAVDQARRQQIARDEIAALTHNLGATYEELHLMYKISAKMSLARPPARALTLIASEIMPISRATAVAFVLNDPELAFSSTVSDGTPATLLSDRIVQIGVGAPTLANLDRLAECTLKSVGSEVGHLLMNNVHRKPEMSWTHDWLDHLIVLPLQHEKKVLGVMFAINCRDKGDFTSVDVQFFRAVADRIVPFLENHQLYGDLADLLMGMLHAMVNSIDAKDAYTCGHSERVAYLSRALARAVNLPEATCDRVYLSGLLHDVGKIGVPDAVLCKPGKLTPEEFAAMRLHPAIGAKILSRVKQIQDLLPGVLHHHERMDGRGYPAGLSGDSIPLFGKIICIADCFDAMTTNRTYRAALPLPVALAEVRRCAGTQFDAALADVFLGMDHAKLMQEAKSICTSDDALAIGRAGRAEIIGVP